jgi:hypothetical protein
VFDVEQARHFIAAISGHKYEALFALALTWADLNLERGTVSVSKTLATDGLASGRRHNWNFQILVMNAN